MPENKHIMIYTDGSSLKNPGPGGYGAVMIFGPHRKEISGGFRLTTNNRMEILAAVKALQALKEKNRHSVTIYTDSELLRNAIEKGWIFKWEKQNWKKRLNSDLWNALLNEYRKVRSLRFQWIKAHAGIEENERCDELAKNAAMGEGLPPDKGYENSLKKT